MVLPASNPKHIDRRFLTIYTLQFILAMIPCCLYFLYQLEVTPLIALINDSLNIVPNIKSIQLPTFGVTSHAYIYSSNRNNAEASIKQLYDNYTCRSVTPESILDETNLCTVRQIIATIFVPNGEIFPATLKGLFDYLDQNLSKFPILPKINMAYNQILAFDNQQFEGNDINQLQIFYDRIVLPGLFTSKTSTRYLQTSLNLVFIYSPFVEDTSKSIRSYLDRSQNTLLIITDLLKHDIIIKEIQAVLIDYYRLDGPWPTIEIQAFDAMCSILNTGKFQRLEVSYDERVCFKRCISRVDNTFAFFALRNCLDSCLNFDDTFESITDVYISQHILKFPIVYKVGIYCPLLFPLIISVVSTWSRIIQAKFKR
ncbi:hypothetical protein GJ496_001833 [Pomphorhynchus laevis]|nr:hypothetical protein GJ496_001833 [Pomphorhynchus laevis]